MILLMINRHKLYSDFFYRIFKLSNVKKNKKIVTNRLYETVCYNFLKIITLKIIVSICYTSNEKMLRLTFPKKKNLEEEANKYQKIKVVL